MLPEEKDICKFFLWQALVPTGCHSQALGTAYFFFRES
jgi:hypothetical protein